MTIGLSLGTGFALIAGLSRLGEDIVDAPLQMIRTLPFLGLVPLFILWLGIGEAPKITLVALGTAFPIYLNLFSGIRGVDAKLMEAGRIFGLDRRGLIRHIVLPGALPSGLVGLRTALVGTSEQVAEAFLEYHDLGVDTFLIRGFDPLEDAIEYGRSLLPATRDLLARRAGQRVAAK